MGDKDVPEEEKPPVVADLERYQDRHRQPGKGIKMMSIVAPPVTDAGNVIA